MFSTEKSIVEFSMEYWLSHLGRREQEVIVKEKKPFLRTKKKWRDVVATDLQAISVKVMMYSLHTCVAEGNGCQ